MTYIEGNPSEDWIEKNRPENGIYKVYWTIDGGATLNPDEGVGLRYEWEYKDGEYADGQSKGWYRNGQLKQTRPWKNGVRDGLRTTWYENGQKMGQGTFKNDKLEGKWTKWYENGNKRSEKTYKDGNKEGLYMSWYENGQKRVEGNYKDGIEIGEWTYWEEDGKKAGVGYYGDAMKKQQNKRKKEITVILDDFTGWCVREKGRKLTQGLDVGDIQTIATHIKENYIKKGE